jgi:uncharacterized protein (TIRG00374 family)
LGRKFRVQSGIFGILIGLACFGLLFRQVDLRQSWHALSGLHGRFLLIPLAVFLLNVPLRALRWRWIFPSSARPGLTACLTVLGIGNMANLLLPGRAGDLARCVLLSRDGSLAESSRTLATLAVERVLDGFAMVGMILFSLTALHPPQWVLQSLRLAIAIFGGLLVLLIVLRYRTRALIETVRRLFRRIHLAALEEKFDGLMMSFADGLTAIDSAKQMLSLLAMTAAVWTTEVALVWAIATSLGFAITPSSALVATAILGLGLMIPAAPAGLGTYELFGTEAFQLVGLAASSALTVTLVIHAWVFVANIALGIALLAAKGLSLAQLRNRIDRTSPPEPQQTAAPVRRSA